MSARTEPARTMMAIAKTAGIARPFLICAQKSKSDYITFGRPVDDRPRVVYIAAIVGGFVLGVSVEKSKGEALRKELSRQSLVDTGRLILDGSGKVIIPLREAPSGKMLTKYNAELVDIEFPDRKSREDPIDDIRARASIPVDLKGLLPSKWESFGDVLVLRLDHRLDPYEREIAQVYALVLKSKAVLRDVGGVAGDLRRPVVRKLLGKDTICTHLENGIRYRFDVSEIMFSSGNIEERIRMADTKCNGETIVDMFAGIGYFSLPLAMYQKPKRVVACEVNPVAHSFLVENIRLNGVEGIVDPVLGDNRDLRGEGLADRILMGYVKTTHEFLPTALRLLKDGGIVHYHETCPNELLPKRPIQRLMDSNKRGKTEILRFKEIKSYAPGVSHVVVDARFFKPA